MLLYQQNYSNGGNDNSKINDNNNNNKGTGCLENSNYAPKDVLLAVNAENQWTLKGEAIERKP